MATIRIAGWLGAFCAALVICGCSTSDPERLELTTGAIPPSDERPQDEPVALGRAHYAKGSYGLAERHFRAAVEANPKSTEAWFGLAAAYDRLRRFDLAERAYKQVLEQVGREPTVLNNLGYHYMLRGDLNKARGLLIEAAQKDPANPYVQGNLRLLDTWKSGELESPS